MGFRTGKGRREGGGGNGELDTGFVGGDTQKLQCGGK